MLVHVLVSKLSVKCPGVSNAGWQGLVCVLVSLEPYVKG